jgi:hypothetical protein
MLKYLLRVIKSAIVIAVLERYRHLSMHLIRIEVAKWYLSAVHMARVSAIGLVGMGLAITLICVGVLILHGGLFVLLPYTVKAKAIFAVVLGLGYVIIGSVALRGCMNEKTWMDKSGAAKMLADVTRHSKTD